MQEYILETERLFLRNWRSADILPFSQMNRDQEVMEFMPKLLSPGESKLWVLKMQQFIAKEGYGLLAVELKETGDFIGYTGIFPVTFSASFTPASEIGWRLAKKYWGKGYATEAAIACLGAIPQWRVTGKLVSFTTISNIRSEAVMKRLPLQKSLEFNHPKLVNGHPLSRHVLYELESGNAG